MTMEAEREHFSGIKVLRIISYGCNDEAVDFRIQGLLS
jgi:hypothetical protein